MRGRSRLAVLAVRQLLRVSEKPAVPGHDTTVDKYANQVGLPVNEVWTRASLYQYFDEALPYYIDLDSNNTDSVDLAIVHPHTCVNHNRYAAYQAW